MRSSWLEETAIAAVAIAATLAIAAIVMHAWNWSPHQPQRYDGDTLFHAMIVKDILHHGWSLTNPSLGAPFGQQLYDFPLGGDNLHMLLIKALGVLSSNVFVVMNLFFALTFALATLTSYIVLRCLGVSRLTSAGISVLYSLLPYHFWRGESHLFLSGYYAVPLALLLLVWALGDSPLVRYRSSTHSSRFRLEMDGRRSLAALACCIVLGMTDSYYAVFAVIILVGCGVLVAIGRSDWQSLAISAVLAAVIALVLAINLAPSLLYRQIHGVNLVAGHRFPLESELYGLKIARLFLPVAGHRIAAFADLSSRYQAFPIAGEANAASGASETLGLVFSLGLIVLLARGLAGRFRPSPEHTWRARTLNTLALAALVAIVVGAMTGLSGIIALLVTPQFRGWNRISVLIAFCAAAGLALILDQLFSRLPVLQSRLLVSALAISVVVILGSLDQTTKHDVPNYRFVSNRITVNTDFMRSIQNRLPAGAMVFQLPYMPFPENGPIYHMQDYEPLQGYLLSDGLRWSYGAIKGRPQDWQPGLLHYPLPIVTRAAAVAGFQAVYLDRSGYSDGGAGVDRDLRSVAGAPVLESADHLLALYDVRPLAALLRQHFPQVQLASMADAALHQVTLGYGAGFYGPETNGTSTWRWASGRAQLLLSNPDSHVKTEALRGTLVTGPGGSTVTISGPGATTSLPAPQRGLPISIDLRIPPGQSVVSVSTDAGREPGDARDLRVELLDPVLVDPVLAPLSN